MTVGRKHRYQRQSKPLAKYAEFESWVKYLSAHLITCIKYPVASFGNGWLDEPACKMPPKHSIIKAYIMAMNMKYAIPWLWQWFNKLWMAAQKLCITHGQQIAAMRNKNLFRLKTKTCARCLCFCWMATQSVLQQSCRKTEMA